MHKQSLLGPLSEEGSVACDRGYEYTFPKNQNQQATSVESGKINVSWLVGGKKKKAAFPLKKGKL